MKILQINKYFYPKGGAETVFFNTIDLLLSFGHKVIPFALKNDKNKPSDYEEFFVDYPELSDSGFITKLKNVRRFIYNKSAAKQLEKIILKEKPDVAHIHLMFNGHSVSILPVLKKYNIPIVLTAHDYRLICPAYTITNGKNQICELCLASQQYWHCITNKCSHGSLLNSTLLAMDSYFRKYFISPFNYIDHFIFVSNFSRNKHIQANKLFESKSSQLYNFTSIKDLTEGDACNGNYVLFYGRISQEKGVSVLLDAAKQLPNLNFKILGDGTLLNDYKENASNNVDFLGFKSGKELVSYIKNARFVVVPSICYENNPMAIVEAMSLGTPAIGSNIGGIPELIEDGTTGFLFEAGSGNDLASSISKAINLPLVEYDKMVDNAQKFAEAQFSPLSHYQSLINIYQSVIRKNS